MKDESFDLYKVLLIATIACFCIGAFALAMIDVPFPSWGEIEKDLGEDLVLKNWHFFAVIICILWSKD